MCDVCVSMGMTDDVGQTDGFVSTFLSFSLSLSFSFSLRLSPSLKRHRPGIHQLICVCALPRCTLPLRAYSIASIMLSSAPLACGSRSAFLNHSRHGRLHVRASSRACAPTAHIRAHRSLHYSLPLRNNAASTRLYKFANFNVPPLSADHLILTIYYGASFRYRNAQVRKHAQSAENRFSDASGRDETRAPTFEAWRL